MKLGNRRDSLTDGVKRESGVLWVAPKKRDLVYVLQYKYT